MIYFMTKYYVDSCIWLTLMLNKEIPSPFFSELLEEDDLFTSEIVIAEVNDVLKRYNQSPSATFIRENSVVLELDDWHKQRAQYLNSIDNLGFGDCINVAYCESHELILVSRDRALINFASQFVQTFHG